jgi:hypothetical protein
MILTLWLKNVIHIKFLYDVRWDQVSHFSQMDMFVPTPFIAKNFGTFSKN